MSNNTIPDYNELLCEAIDTIVTSRISSLPFDETIVCTITTVINKDKGEYEVSDGSTVFIAYANTVRTYFEKDKVYVLIPQSDYTQKKTITGPYQEDDKPIGYAAPSEKILELIKVYSSQEDVDAYPKKLSANEGNILNGSELEIHQTNVILFDKTLSGEKVAVSDSIYIQAKFKSLLDTYQFITGSYGIALDIYTNQSDTPSSILLLDSKRDMFGNPYGYSLPSQQEVSFCVSSVDSTQGNQIQRIVGRFYQRGNFITSYDNDGNPIYLQSSGAPNLQVLDVNVGMGLNVENISNYTVKLISPTNRQYSDSHLDKDVLLLWINKTDNNKYIGFTDGVMAQSNLEIEYAKGEKAREENDEKNYYYIEWTYDVTAGVKNKLEGSENKTTVTVPCSTSLSTTTVSATVWRNGIAYTSKDPLEFENIGGSASDPFTNLGIKLILEHDSSSQDFYAMYGGDNKLKNPTEAIKERTIRWVWSYDKGTVDNSFWEGAIVQWNLPKNATMITFDEKYHESFIIDAEHPMPDVQLFKYKIKDTYSPLYINNTIGCTITKGEGKHQIKANLLLLFQPFGTIGTTYTLAVRPKANDAIFGFIENPSQIGDEKIFPQGTIVGDYIGVLSDADGKEIENATINLNMYPIGGESFSSDSFNMIQATSYQEWNSNTVSLTTHYPITYSKNGRYYADVPTKIIYDSFGKIQGSPIMDLKLFDFQSQTELNCAWELKSRGSINAIKTEAVVYEKQKKMTYQGECYFDSAHGKRVFEVLVSSFNFDLIDIENFQLKNNTNYSIKFLDQLLPDEDKNLYMRFIYIDDGDKENIKETTEPVANINDIEWQEEEVLSLIYYNGSMRYDLDIIQWALEVSPIYLQNFLYSYFYLVAKIEGEIVWSSPLLLEQYVYQSDIFNNWNGTFTIDEDKNRILSASGVFGKKDNINAFTGVILGDIGKNYIGNNYKSGIIGLQAGKQSFGILTDGTGFIGPSGKGRIFFDGDSKGIIAGGGWLNGDSIVAAIPSGTSGAKIDFAEGEFSFNGSDGSYFKLDNGELSASMKEFEFFVNGKATTAETYLTMVDGKIESAVKQGVNWYATSEYIEEEKKRILEIYVSDEEKFNQIKNEPIQFSPGTIFSVYFGDERRREYNPEEKIYVGDEKEEVIFHIVYISPFGTIEPDQSYILNTTDSWTAGDTMGLVLDYNNYLSFTSVSSSRIIQTATNISLEVTDGLSEDISRLELRADGIEANVQANGQSIANLTIKSNEISTQVKDTYGYSGQIQLNDNDEGTWFDIYINDSEVYDNTNGDVLVNDFFKLGTIFQIISLEKLNNVKNYKTYVWVEKTIWDEETGESHIPPRVLNHGEPITIDVDNWPDYSRLQLKYIKDGEEQKFISVPLSESQMQQLSDQFLASVHTNENAFSWKMDANGFYLNDSKAANINSYIFKCDSGGVEVKGHIEATSGKIGEWKILEGNPQWLVTVDKYGMNPIQDGISGVAIQRPSSFNTSNYQMEDIFLLCRQQVNGDSYDNFVVFSDGHVVARDITITGGSCSNVAITGGSTSNTVIKQYSDAYQNTPELEIKNHYIISRNINDGGAGQSNIQLQDGELRIIATPSGAASQCMIIGGDATKGDYSVGISFGDTETYTNQNTGIHYSTSGTDAGISIIGLKAPCHMTSSGGNFIDVVSQELAWYDIIATSDDGKEVYKLRVLCDKASCAIQ